MISCSRDEILDMVVFALNSKDYIYVWEAGHGVVISTNGGLTFSNANGAYSNTYQDNWWRGSIAVAPSDHLRVLLDLFLSFHLFYCRLMLRKAVSLEELRIYSEQLMLDLIGQIY